MSDPKYKDAVGMADPGVAAPTYPLAAYFMEQKGLEDGEAWFTSLFENGMKAYPKNPQVVKALSSGEISIINEPSVILFDEPLCNLDVQLRVEMRTEMAEIFHAIHTTVFHVTHDPSEAFAMADRIVIMNAGRIDQIASPQECYQKPASAVTAGLLGAGNQLPARYEREDLVSVDGCSSHVSVIGSHGREMTLRFRAEDCAFQRDPAEDALPAVCSPSEWSALRGL